MWRTLELAVDDLLFFTLNLLIMLAAFGFCSTYTFGLSVKGYHNVMASFTSWFRTAVGEGEYDYEAMSVAWSLAAPFLILFVMVVVVVAMNTFIAILSTAYEEAKDESKEWNESRQKLRDHYTDDESGLYNEPQDMVDLYELAKDAWARFKYGMKVRIYSGYKVEDDPKQQDVHHLKVGHQVWLKMDSNPIPKDSEKLAHLNGGGSPYSDVDNTDAAMEESVEADGAANGSSNGAGGSPGRSRRNVLDSETHMFETIQAEGTEVEARTRLFISCRIQSLHMLQGMEQMRRNFHTILQRQEQAKQAAAAEEAAAGEANPRRTLSTASNSSRAGKAFESIENAIDPSAHLNTTFQLRLNGEEYNVAEVKLSSLEETVGDLPNQPTKPLPGFVQLNKWMVMEVTKISSWHSFKKGLKQKEFGAHDHFMRIRRYDSMYWVQSQATFLQLLRIEYFDLVWKVPIAIFAILGRVFTFGFSLIIEKGLAMLWKCCGRRSAQKDSEEAQKKRRSLRAQRLRFAATTFLRMQVKALGERNPNPGNVLKSMKFYAKHRIPLVEFAPRLEHHIYKPPRAWRFDRQLYRWCLTTLGFDSDHFDEEDERLLLEAFNHPELFMMNLLNFTSVNDDGGDTDDEGEGGGNDRTAWIDQQEQNEDNHMLLQHLKGQMHTISEEVQMLSAGLSHVTDALVHLQDKKTSDLFEGAVDEFADGTQSAHSMPLPCAALCCAVSGR